MFQGNQHCLELLIKDHGAFFLSSANEPLLLHSTFSLLPHSMHLTALHYLSWVHRKVQAWQDWSEEDCWRAWSAFRGGPDCRGARSSARRHRCQVLLGKREGRRWKPILKGNCVTVGVSPALFQHRTFPSTHISVITDCPICTGW